MRVIAIERGHDGRQIREPGEEFDMPGIDGTWYVEAEKSVSAPAKAEAKPKGKASKAEAETDASDIA